MSNGTSEAKTREELAFSGALTFVYVRGKDGRMRLVEKDTFYDLAGDALEDTPQREACWYLRDGAVPEDGIITKRRSIDDVAEPESTPVITLKPVGQTSYQRLAVVPVYRR